MDARRRSFSPEIDGMIGIPQPIESTYQLQHRSPRATRMPRCVFVISAC
jgi:hypothetical protein